MSGGADILQIERNDSDDSAFDIDDLLEDEVEEAIYEDVIQNHTKKAGPTGLMALRQSHAAIPSEPVQLSEREKLPPGASSVIERSIQELQRGLMSSEPTTSDASRPSFTRQGHLRQDSSGRLAENITGRPSTASAGPSLPSSGPGRPSRPSASSNLPPLLSAEPVLPRPPTASRPSTARSRPTYSAQLISQSIDGHADAFSTMISKLSIAPRGEDPLGSAPSRPAPSTSYGGRPSSARPGAHGGPPTHSLDSEGMKGEAPAAAYPVLAGSLASALSRLSRKKKTGPGAPAAAAGRPSVTPPRRPSHASSSAQEEEDLAVVQGLLQTKLHPDLAEKLARALDHESAEPSSGESDDCDSPL